MIYGRKEIILFSLICELNVFIKKKLSRSNFRLRSGSLVPGSKFSL